MARQGQFSGGTAAVGRSLSFVHPRDNNFEKGKYAPELLGLKLSDSKRDELQQRIDDLYKTFLGERDFL